MRSSSATKTAAVCLPAPSHGLRIAPSSPPPPPVFGDVQTSEELEEPAPKPKPKPAAAAAPAKGKPAKAAASGKAAASLFEAADAGPEAGSSSGEEEEDAGADLFGDGKRQLSKRAMRKLGIRPQLWKVRSLCLENALLVCCDPGLSISVAPARRHSMATHPKVQLCLDAASR